MTLDIQTVRGLRFLPDSFSEASDFCLVSSDFSILKLEQLGLANCDQIRVVATFDKEFPHTLAAKNMIISLNDASIEAAKLEDEDARFVQTALSAMRCGKWLIRGYFHDSFPGSILLTTEGPCFGGTATCSKDGLTRPIRFMLPVPEKNRKDFESLFQRTWRDGIDLTPDFIALLEKHLAEYPPYVVYLKALFELFRGQEAAIGDWEERDSRVYPVLSEYQRDGYRQLLHISNKYSGALLCDGVGLGKTFVALMLIERLVHERKRVAIIVPKSTRDAVWEIMVERYIPQARSVFGSQVVIYNHTDLLRNGGRDRDFSAEMEEIRNSCDAIIVDEAHHFRNLNSGRSQKLYEITENKLVFLLTATPINNSLFDLQHLMEFFTRKRDDRFAHLGINSIRGHLVQKEKVIAAKMGITQDDAILTADIDDREAERILKDDTLFREVVVQRSRNYVKRQEGLRSKAILFPERQTPHVAAYSLADTYGSLLDELKRVFNPENPLLKLPIYYPLAYARKPAESTEDRFEENRQKQVVGLVRTTMLKRFESSWKAFQYTCEDLLLKLLAAVKQMDEKRFHRWREDNALFLSEVEKHTRERYEGSLSAFDLEEDDLVDSFIDDNFSLDNRMVKVSEILKDTLKDLNILLNFLGFLRGLDATTDTKAQTLLNLLQTDPLLSKHKVIIFSEFRDTARYLNRYLKDNAIGEVMEIDSGSKVDRLEVIRRFAPFYNYETETKHKTSLTHPVRVLISTDILAEGLNLQDAFLLINYDLHWNPVRLMQRIGRVDRRMNGETEKKILTAHPEQQGLRGKMWFWNFLPPGELNDLLSLYNRVSHKVLRISETTGLEGRQLLTPGDAYKPLEDFNAAYEGQASIEESLRLRLTEALTRDQTLEETLQTLPGRVFSAKASRQGQATGIFACYRFPESVDHRESGQPGELKWYFLPDDREELLTGIDAIHALIACEPDTPRIEPRPTPERRDRLDRLHALIKGKDLKKRKNLTMAQVAEGTKTNDALKLVAWMEVRSTPTTQ